MDDLLEEYNNKYLNNLLLKRSIEVKLKPLSKELEKTENELARLEVVIAELSQKEKQLA